MNARGKELEAGAIVHRVNRELGDLMILLKRDRDADMIRGKIVAAREILEVVSVDIDTRTGIQR